MMLRSRGVNAVILTVAAAFTCSCGQTGCDTDKARSIVRQDLKKITGEPNAYVLTFTEQGANWIIDAQRPDAGTGGQSIFAVHKTTCKIVDARRYQ